MFVWLISKNGLLAHAVNASLKRKKICYLATSKDQVDILDAFQIHNFLDKNKVTHIINCAAYTDVEKAEVNRKAAFATNVIGVQNLVAAIKGTSIKLIHYSTDYVFDGKKSEAYLETDRCNPINYYGLTKRIAEESIEKVLSDYLIIRTSWLFGFKKNSFPSKIYELMQKNTSLSVIDDQIGRATFCEDLAEATLCMLDQSGIFNFANENALSWYDYALAIFNSLKKKGLKLACVEIKPVKSDQFKTIAKRPRYSVLSTNKFSSLNKLKIRAFSECLEQYLDQEYGIH